MTNAEDIPKDVLDAVLRLSVDDRIPCPVARKIAEDFAVPYRVVGEAANQAGVRIKGCELGCF